MAAKLYRYLLPSDLNLSKKKAATYASVLSDLCHLPTKYSKAGHHGRHTAYILTPKRSRYIEKKAATYASVSIVEADGLVLTALVSRSNQTKGFRILGQDKYKQNLQAVAR